MPAGTRPAPVRCASWCTRSRQGRRSPGGTFWVLDRPAQHLVGLPQNLDLVLEFMDLVFGRAGFPGLDRGDTGNFSTVDPMLLDPLLRAGLRDSNNRRSLRDGLPRSDKRDCTTAELGGVLACRSRSLPFRPELNTQSGNVPCSRPVSIGPAAIPDEGGGFLLAHHPSQRATDNPSSTKHQLLDMPPSHQGHDSATLSSGSLGRDLSSSQV